MLSQLNLYARMIALEIPVKGHTGGLQFSHGCPDKSPALCISDVNLFVPLLTLKCKDKFIMLWVSFLGLSQ